MFTRRRVGGAGEKVTTGNIWPQPRERDEGAQLQGPQGTCVVSNGALHGEFCVDSGQATADKDGVRPQAN